VSQRDSDIMAGWLLYIREPNVTVISDDEYGTIRVYNKSNGRFHLFYPLQHWRESDRNFRMKGA